MCKTVVKKISQNATFEKTAAYNNANVATQEEDI